MNSGWLAWECIVFAVFICASSCLPLWKRRKDTKEAGGNAKQAYIFAGGGVSLLAMILSVARGTLGVRSFLGFPSELVYRGSAMWETLYGIVLAFPLVCFLFVPVYYRLHTNSVYEYLQMRFNSIWVRRLAAATFVVRQILNLSVTVYTPTVALHAVLALPHWGSAAMLTAVAIVFNLLGGLAAAIRADVIQTTTMILVSAAFIIQGTVRAGGPQNVVQGNIAGGRLQFFKFTGDPTVRVDTLSAFIGQLFMSLSIYGCQQTFVQRYCSLSNESKVRRMLLANVPAVSVLFSLSWIVGMVLYSVYQYCDPFASGSIAAPDEVLPYYVEDQFSFLPGMLGLFLGSLFNGALSFLVSNVNSLATVTWEDFVSAAPAFKGTTDKQQLTVIKIIGVVYAILIMCLSLCVGIVGGVVEGSLLVTSATSGALLGVFILATICPMANGKGATIGMLASHFITTWMAAGRLMYVDKSVAMLPLSVENCPNSTKSLYNVKPLPIGVNETLLQLAPLFQAMNHSHPVKKPAESVITSGLHTMYSISYMWYAVIGTITCVTLGVIISLITAKDTDMYDERLLHPLIAKLSRKWPGRKRQYTSDKAEKVPEQKDTSEQTEETVVESVQEINEVKPTPVNVNNSRLFDAYETRTPSPLPERTKL
ncbi:sodium-coupled monocarboxylate transporter 2 [Galleria mellonella]|uniref:Sodium-coupled monocarboxylate transporter 2 n=1 Tax=Galleria mellonella TaxID=7137 RepID=A0A6J1WHE1_GALME|nr:sodium-coupled monocarboxylate transporter 2 [Galleria mellonella]XP_031763962.2 sodium-coupled monocarboxylate transporter 2 [Galleria mellonella]XP_052752861.1 sodium-coupled monocarboxylate transporter 2 [Galleria mellonella]XP_052752862.1 sodium-coupled monocarboxylate transporter 2 [Galleria mellonella]